MQQLIWTFFLKNSSCARDFQGQDPVLSFKDFGFPYGVSEFELDTKEEDAPGAQQLDPRPI